MGITKVTAKVIQHHHLHIVAGGPTWKLHIAWLTCCWLHPAARKLKGTGLDSALRLCASGKVYTIDCPTFKCPLLENSSSPLLPLNLRFLTLLVHLPWCQSSLSCASIPTLESLLPIKMKNTKAQSYGFSLCFLKFSAALLELYGTAKGLLKLRLLTTHREYSQ